MSGNQAIHPARDTLAAYGLGKLPPAEAEAVETHIAACEECCETLLDVGSDTFVDLVRRSDAMKLESMTDHGTIALKHASRETISDLPDEIKQHPRYRVLELLGMGGMGNVYKAEHTLMNRVVALKLINHELVQNAQAVERFRREVQSAAQLAHTNIVTAHDAEQAGDVHFLVMEYVPGYNLSHVVKREGPLETSRACDYIRQAAWGLQHAHEQGMVHRDIKPHNLMLSTDGTVKILDFGLATLAAQTITSEAIGKASNDSPTATKTSRLTTLGTMMGTPDFISPEQANDPQTADIRSDIYSLGCTFYYLLTGRPPFTDGSALKRVKAHAESEPQPIENVRADITPELAEIVRRMMAKQPAKRFHTPADLADALAPFVADSHPVPAPRKVVKPRPGTTLSRWSCSPPTIVSFIAFAAVTILLAGVIYVATDNGARTPLTSTVRKAWINPKSSGAPSPDGRWFTFTHWERSGDLGIRDLTDGSEHLLTGKGSWAQSRDYAWSHVWSPDGQQVAYTWATAENGFALDLRVIGRDGSNERVLLDNSEYYYLQPFAWSGSQILVGVKLQDGTNQLGLISVDDGMFRVLRSLKWEFPINASLSPDGRFVVYDRLQADDSTRRDIFLLATDGQTETRLVEHVDHDYSPVWAPDGRGVVFNSDRNGSVSLWVLEVVDGQPNGAPQPTGINMTRMIPLGMARTGSYFYSSSVKGLAAGNVYVAEIDLVTGKLTAPPKLLTRRYEGLNTSPTWSADGKHVAYFSHRGPMTSRNGWPDTLVIHSLESGEIRVLIPDHLYWRAGDTQPQWSPDEQTLLVNASAGATRETEGIYTVDVVSGEFDLVCETGGRTFKATWSPDGTKIYYLDPSEGIVVWSRESQQKTTFLSQEAAESESLGAFWDGRAGSLEEQVLQPIQNEKELYLSLQELETRLREDQEYLRYFEEVFGREPNAHDVARALASFVRSLLVGDSPYDRYLLGDHEALPESVRRGLRLFRGKANCASCHAGPNLTDEEFHNTGVAWRDGKLLDEGRYAVTTDDSDRGAFKTPTLRQVSQTAPYMHDGSLATLTDVVERYNQGGVPNPNLDREIRPLRLTKQEKKDLLAFLESLTGNIRFQDAGDEAKRTTASVR